VGADKLGMEDEEPKYVMKLMTYLELDFL